MRGAARGEGNTMTTDKKQLVPLSPDDFAMLEWLAAWTPEVHQSSWTNRRRWPPGFREVADTSVHQRSEIGDAIKARLAWPPCKDGRRIVARLLAYRLAEGTWGCARLTPRGRAALKLDGRLCPDAFESHAANVFDDVPLIDPTGPDNEDAWREMLVEYRDNDYRGRHTLTGATASLCPTSSTGTNLNGSIRGHNRFLTFCVRNAAHQEILRLNLSFEGLAELLTSHMETPITLDRYIGADGMPRSEPAPPPVSASARMVERLSAVEDVREARILEIRQKIAGANIGKRLQEELLRDLDFAASSESGRAFAVQQAVEELSVAVESAMVIAAERHSLAGLVSELLPPAVSVLAIEAASDETLPGEI
jgi:hypothetical protein